MDPSEVAEIVAREWQRGFAAVRQGRFFKSLEDGSFFARHYKGFLRETYHNVAVNPRLGCCFLAKSPYAPSPFAARLLRHLASEVGHDALALADLAALGEDPGAVESGRPLPATEALAAFVLFQIEHRHPLAYLGYVYHLEAMAADIGEKSMEALARAGIPRGAMSFLKEHAENDPVHMRYNLEYLEGFVKSTEDLEAVRYGVRGSCALYGAMCDAIMDTQSPARGDWEKAPASERPLARREGGHG